MRQIPLTYKSDEAVLATLRRLAGDGDEVQLPAPKLAAAAGVSRATLYRALDRLRDSGYLTTTTAETAWGGAAPAVHQLTASEEPPANGPARTASGLRHTSDGRPAEDVRSRTGTDPRHPAVGKAS